jgi:hypothetical protein
MKRKLAVGSSFVFLLLLTGCLDVTIFSYEKQYEWADQQGTSAHYRASPDGQTVVFSDNEGRQREINNNGLWELMDYEIYITSKEKFPGVHAPVGSNQLTHNALHDLHPSWSQDGQEIVFASGPEILQKDAVNLIEKDGSNFRTIYAEPERNISHPTLSSLGYVAYSLSDPQETDPRSIVVTNGQEYYVVVSDQMQSQYIWSPNGQFLAVANRDNFILFDAETKKVHVADYGQIDQIGSDPKKNIAGHHPSSIFWTTDSKIVQIKIIPLGGLRQHGSAKLFIFADRLISQQPDWHHLEVQGEMRATGTK